jgi:hypothetical protein
MPIKEHHLENLQEAETYLWVKEGLERLDKLLQSIDADDDLLDLIDYLKDDNWPCVLLHTSRPGTGYLAQHH